MKIKCKVCGNDNDLGRVFCLACGARLDLTHISIQDVQAAQVTDRRHTVLKWIVWVICAGAAAALALAAWPRRVDPGEISPAGESRIAYGIELLVSGKYPALFMETKDINGYLRAKGRAAGFSDMSIRLADGFVTVAAERAWGPWKALNLSVGPVRLTWEFTAKPKGGKLAISRGAVGHLSLYGPPAALLASRTASRVPRTEREREALAKLKSLSVLAKGIEISVGK